MAFKRSGVRFSYAPQKSLSEWSEGDFSCLVAPIMITAKIGWIQEGRTDFSSASRARITGRPAMPISRVVWSRRRCEPPDSAFAAQTKQHTCLCRSSETAILTRNSVATQTQQGNGQCLGREVLLSILNDNGSLFRQTGAQRPRDGVSVGHTDVRHSLILNCPLKVGRVIDLF